MPLLSAGKHRTPRQGACFMEFASYLAGERWSDHPACTHPLLAALARNVNDLTSIDGRDKLMPLVNRVVGLTTDDPMLASIIAMRAASAALPIVSMERQRALATGMLSLLGRADSPELRELADAAFEQTPDSRQWAERYLASARVTRRDGDRANEAIVHTATIGIALACTNPSEPSSDARLLTLLTEVIEAAEAMLTTTAEARTPALV